MMKKLMLVAGFVVMAGCASTQTADIDTAPAANTGLASNAVEPGSQADLEQTAGHRVFFGYDQYTLTPQAQATLRKQAEWMLDNSGVRVQLAGNADERGTREYNLALGARRAAAAKAYLVSLGVPADRIGTISHGKERPIDTASNEQAWAKNRNSTTTVLGVAS